MMKIYKIETVDTGSGIIKYTILTTQNNIYDIVICFVYLEKINAIHPGIIFIRETMRLVGGYTYINPKYLYLKEMISSPFAFDETDYTRFLKEQFPELTTFSDTILDYIDKYCGIYKPTIAYDFERAKASP